MSEFYDELVAVCERLGFTREELEALDPRIGDIETLVELDAELDRRP